MILTTNFYTSTKYLTVAIFKTAPRRVLRPTQPIYCRCKAAGS